MSAATWRAAANRLSVKASKIPTAATEQALADKQANPLTLKRKDSLLDEQQQAQSESNRLIESIGAMTQKLKDNEDKKAISNQLKASLSKQNLQVWRQLNELIGSSSGKKFRAFAQT